MSRVFRSFHVLSAVLSIAAMIGLHTTASAQIVFMDAWGNNNNGQCNVPAPPAGTHYTGFEGGSSHTIALRSNGSAVAFGLNSSGQCNVPAPPPGIGYTQVAASSASSFGLRSDGNIAAWGSGSSGILSVPALLPSITYTSVAAGYNHALATRSDGFLAAWGSNSSGQGNVPSLPVGVTYTQAAGGLSHSVALRSNGTVVGWGSNALGQNNVPSLPGGMSYLEVAAGANHTVARRSDGAVLAWGSNGNGQCNVPSLPSGTSYIGIAAGENHTLALRSDGALIGWGLNTSGQTNAPSPQLQRYTTVAAGAFHSMGLREPACAALNYCSPKVNNLGCAPTMSWSGSTSMSGPNDLLITASNLTSKQAGIMIWSASPFSAPFYGGTLCVEPPILRTPVQHSGGNSGPFDCSGTFAFHFSHAYMAQHGVTAGTPRFAQYWMRDIADPLALHVGLTDGLMFMICP